MNLINAVVGGAIPKEYIPAIDAGIKEAALNGIIAGYNVINFKVKLVHGSYHEVDSSEMAFKIAGSMAFKNAMAKANPVLLEPMMKVEVTVPKNIWEMLLEILIQEEVEWKEWKLLMELKL